MTGPFISRNTLDWMSLVDDQEQANIWLKSVVSTGSASLQLRPRADQEGVLWHLYSAQRAARRLEGRQVLFFTYPHIIEMVNGGVEATALLRWPCKLEPPVNNRPNWKLSVEASAQSKYNKDWCDQLAEQFPGDWHQFLSSCLDASEEGLEKLSEFARYLVEHSDYRSGSEQAALSTLPAAILQQENLSSGELWWSASLALDTNNWESKNSIPKHWREPLSNENTAIGDLALSRLSPSQYQFFKYVCRERYALIEGEADARLSNSCLELIKLALWRGKTCLVVSRKKAELEKVYDQFLNYGQLKDFCFLWQDEQNDLPILEGRFRTFEKSQLSASSYDPLQWRTLLSRSNRFQRQYDSWYEASRRAVFGEKSWSDVLGYYLHYARTADKALLASQLNAGQYAFTPTEYQEISKAIERTRPLFEKLGSLHHPLNNLNAAIFIHQDIAESQDFIRNTSHKFLQLARQLRQRYVRIQSLYADQLAGFHETHYLELRTGLEVLEERWEDSHNAFGADTLRSGNSTLKLYGRFSKKFRQALEQKEKIQEGYSRLMEMHEPHQVFSFEWSTAASNQLMVQLGEQIRAYRSKLEDWRASISSRIQDELVRLNYKTAISSLEASAGIEQLEQDLEVFIDEVNSSGLYQLPLQSKTLTLARQQKYLEEIIDKLEQSKEGLSEYDDFYHWQRSWFSLSEIARKTIQALLRSRPNDWIAAFSSWYFNECLQMNYDPFPVQSAKAGETYISQVEQLRAQLPGVIRKDWEARRAKAMQEIRPLLRDWPQELSALMDNYGSAIAQSVPVSFANPEVGAALAKNYDLVILEKAQGLSLDDTSEVLVHAKQLAAIADTNQLALTVRGVVPMMQKGDVPRVFSADATSPGLMEVWSGKRMQIHLHQIDGRFDEAKQTNEVEAQELVKLLNSIESRHGKFYPQVGIICLSTAQRDLIQGMLYRIKKEGSPGAALVLQLERNGLTVLTASEASGQQFEVVMYSPAFGPLDHQGHLPLSMSRLNQAAHKASLAILEEVLKQADIVHLLNSMPLDEISERQNWVDRPGEQLHALTIAAADAYHRQDYPMLQQVQQAWPVDDRNSETGDAIARELAYRLAQQLPSWKWTFDVAHGTQEQLLTATSPKGIAIVLLTDGYVAQSKHTTLDWENWQKDRLRLSGYQLLTYSSEELWKNPALTCHRLVNKLVGLATKAREEE